MAHRDHTRLSSRAACREKHVRNYSKLLIDVLHGTLLSKSELQELDHRKCAPTVSLILKGVVSLVNAGR
jgi:hypothetical protein